MKGPSLTEKFTFVLVGRSGCGKGTQAQYILKRLEREGVLHMETGKFLRELLVSGNPTTDRAQQFIMEKGGLFPWWFPMFLWLRELIQHGHADKHIVGDGTPRRVAEAKFLDDVMSWHDRPLPICIYVDVSRGEVMRRLLARGRADDRRDVIRNRLNYFTREVMPVIHYYARRGRMIRVDGSLAPEEVFAQIDRGLAEKVGTQWSRSA
jgi:adenylate kinase